MNSSAVFRLGILGAMANELFAARVEGHQLKPKHVGLMVILDTARVSSQLAIGVLGVAPSMVVALADHLYELGAIQRVRDPADRRLRIRRSPDQGGGAVLTGLLDGLTNRHGLSAAPTDRPPMSAPPLANIGTAVDT
ncbi:hypothetical protein ACWCQQ_18785 [Streptomyces sp. NPDC002143]